MQFVKQFTSEVFYTGSAICFCFLFQEHCLEVFRGTGSSMEPVIKHNTVMLVDKITPKFRKVRKDEVVILRSLHNSKEYICKRVLHTANETIKLQERDVYIPEGFVWVEGDNRNFSFDSRHYGPLSDFLIVGIVRSMIYPEFKAIGQESVNQGIPDSKSDKLF